MNKKYAGFSKLANKHKNNMSVRDVLSPNTDDLILAVLFHAALLGALFGQGTNRAGTSVKWYVKLDDDYVEFWANSPEEALQALFDLNEQLVATCLERGLIEKAPLGSEQGVTTLGKVPGPKAA